LQKVEPFTLADTVPPGQASQVLNPGVLEKYPFAHCVQDIAPEGLDVPIGHITGALNPPAHEYPCGHITLPPTPWAFTE
jgi:hypothetical protein